MSGLRRRCNWCGIELRWWQLNFCRPCKRALFYGHPSPPCPEGSRWFEGRRPASRPVPGGVPDTDTSEEK